MQFGTKLAGWISFGMALGVAVESIIFLHTHTTTGSPTLTLGLVGAFLGFSAAAFGIDAKLLARPTPPQSGQS